MPGIYLFPVAGTSSVKKDPYTKIKRQEITFLVKRFLFLSIPRKTTKSALLYVQEVVTITD